MKEKIVQYFTEELQEKPARAAEMFLKLQRHPDILNEFAAWVESRNFPAEGEGLVVEGYCAQKLAQTTYLEPIGVYNYMIYFREKPAEALSNLKKGLPRK